MLMAGTLLLCFLIAPVLSISGAGLNPGITVKPGSCTKPEVSFVTEHIFPEESACDKSLFVSYSPATFTFKGSSQLDNVNTWSWNLGDGAATGKTVTHTYVSASDHMYMVTLDGTNSCGSDQASGAATVYGPTSSTIVLVTSPSNAYLDSIWEVDGTPIDEHQRRTVPTGQQVTIKINRAGYQPFTKTIGGVAGKNICVEANLVLVSSSSSSPVTLPSLNTGTTYVTPVTNPTNNHALTGTGGSLFITSTPSGAAVFMNSDAKGTTPATLTGIVPGTYTVLLKKSGYPDYTTSTAIIAGQVTTINADLTKGPQAAATNAPAVTATTAPVPGEGSLSVSTTPQGAQVFIDGVVRGMTPATIPGLPAGQHTVLLTLDGYQEFNTTVSIPDGKTAEFNTALAKTQKSPGFAGIVAVLVIAGICLFRKGRV
jgi:hypothetical protein